MIDLISYFDLIKNMNYALTKTDVPYNPNNFPWSYAVGKDLDIFVSKHNFNELINLTEFYFSKYREQFKIKLIYKKKQRNYRLRLEEKEKKKLHYQIDITINDELIKNRINKNNFFILSLDNEKKVRENEVKKHPKDPKKSHHKEWLSKYN